MPDLPEAVEPGTRLVARYRLDQHLGGRGERGSATVTTTGGTQVAGATYWRAQDELLERPVGVWLLRSGTSYARRVLAAARRAAALTDARFLRILDAAEGDGLVYVVSEWVPARSLHDLLLDGPLPPAEARNLTAEITGALGAAHEVGLHHLALQPEHVLRAAHGQVKLAGLEVEAAARGRRVEDPAEADRLDTRGAASILYAALTARWPDEASTGPTGLPPAPLDGTAVCSPRQVRAGVPDDLDDIVSRALDLPGRHGPPLHTVTDLGAALAAAQVTSRLPVPGLGGNAADGDRPSATDRTVALAEGTYVGGSYVGGAYVGSPEDEPVAAPRRSRLAVAAWLLVTVVLLVGVGLASGQLLTGLDDNGGKPRTGSGQQASADDKPETRLRALPVASATGFDPEGEGDADGAENDNRAGLAVDGDPGTVWHTNTYLDPFGPSGLKNGVGLLIELAEPADVTEIVVQPRGGATDLQLRVAEEKGRVLSDFTRVDADRNVDRRVTLRPQQPVTARFVLIWLTAVPAVDGGYRGEIAEVSLRG